MTNRDICDAYNRLARNHKLPAMGLQTLQVHTQDYADPEAAWKAWQQIAPEAGWLQFQSNVSVFAQGSLPRTEPGWGLLLEAEACHQDGRALQLRTLGPTGLRLVIATPGHGHTEYLTDEVRQLATGKVGYDYLRYRRYWRLDSDRGALPVFAAFLGFSGRSNQEAA